MNIDWCVIPAGTAKIGKDNQEMDLPGFRMSKFEVTEEQFHEFVEDLEGYKNPKWWQGLEKPEECKAPYSEKTKNHPVTFVNYYEAVAFCRWFSVKLGYEVKLPTSEQWEYACRGPEGLLYPWGNDFDNLKCNSFHNPNTSGTTPVDTFPEGASPFGVMDMAGNVWEWTDSSDKISSGD